MGLSCADGSQPATENVPGQGAADEDPPLSRRRRAVLAGYDGDGPGAAALAVDPDPSVRAAAFGALLRLGALDDALLLGALADADPGVRRRACVIAGREGGSGRRGVAVVAALTRALGDGDSSVVESAAWALGEFGATCGAETVTEVCRVAREHRSPVCREAAVATLGAIGAGDSLPVVLAALDDTANIRRRAAIALAAFDDPAADEGLRRCLGDRDWQVRQAAEVLLAED